MEKVVRKLILWLGMFAFALSYPSAWAAKRPGGLVIECEFLLTNPQDTHSAQKWLGDALGAIADPEPVHAGFFPRRAAFLALGLPGKYPRGTTMRIQLPRAGSEAFWIRVFTKDGIEIAGIPFHVPPILIWKQVKDWGDNTLVELNRNFEREDSRVISVGAPLGDFENGRKFVVVRRRVENLITVAVGIDVPLVDYKTYTEAQNPTVVTTGDEKILSRVEVIKAHFRIPQAWNHRNPLSGPRGSH